METTDRIQAMAERFLAAWTSQDVERVLACYTEDLTYRDPATRGAVEGAGAFRRYLAKLFDRWEMTWTLRAAHPVDGGRAAAVLWSATLRPAGSSETAAVDGMDWVVLEGDRIRHNEVYFDRTRLGAAAG